MTVEGTPMIESLEKAGRIIEYLSENDGGRIVDVADGLGLPKATAFRYLQTLEATGLVLKRENRFHLSLHWLYHGSRARDRYDPESLIHGRVREIAESTRERAQFVVLEQTRPRFLYRELGDRAVRTDTRVGKAIPIHASSSGKVILANLPPSHRRDVLDDISYERYTDKTIHNRDHLEAELDTIREQGYALNREEYLDRLRAVSVPVNLGPGIGIAAIGVSGPTPRIETMINDGDLVDMLRGTANEIELRYGPRAQRS